MEKRLIKAFQKAKYQMNVNLPENIWQAIVLRDKCINRIKLWAFSAIGVSSFIGLVPVFRIMLKDLTQSGFYEYFSLAFSSNGLIITYWKDFLLLLAESLPIMSIIMFLMLIFIFLLSLKYITKQIIKGQLALSF
ncbi:MAG: hypothetical protein UR91_C0048G0002 [Candidatus Nomurabacteria bacterium GW2011_GWC2_35_8]|uniref:Uncharacterized protein n=1 Tax=Candidatus Nomurabacteria bacterium GW2011_GWC2_35_8 TaxID=1618752 RepID=A0A0G0D296_9BACT|nr:MAG: hypothetical protein UR91_C0048G0002 [Candidatus Nomurabacteria bacterium GW2011_GWC2_35_8]